MIKNSKLKDTITKLIDATKKEQIYWQPLSDESEIFSFPKDEDRAYALKPILGESVIDHRSFYCKTSTAIFFLIAVGNMTTIIAGSFRLELYIQLDGSPHTRLLARSSADESEEAKTLSVALKRLHNVVESIDPEYDNKIDDFLDIFLNS